MVAVYCTMEISHYLLDRIYERISFKRRSVAVIKTFVLSVLSHIRLDAANAKLTL